MKPLKELTLINKETLEIISKIIEISNEEWHKMVNGTFIETLSKEEVYQLLYCSKKEQFFISGNM